MKRRRRNHGPTCKAQVTLATVKVDKTLAELADRFQIHPTQITEWKQQLLARARRSLGEPRRRPTRRILKRSTPKLVNWLWRMIF